MTTTPAQHEPIQIELLRLYAREQSCKVPQAPDIFTLEGPHHVQTEVNIQFHPYATQQIEVMLGLTVTTKCQDRTVLILELKQCGQFKTDCTDPDRLTWLCQVEIPTLLFPYARKTIADMMLTAGLSAHLLPPIDFATLYRQRQTKAGSLAQPESLAQEAIPSEVV